MLHCLVADGNVRDAREEHLRATGRTSAQAYAALLKALATDVSCTLISPADVDAALPAGADLAGFDALVLTGSALHVTEDRPAVRRQLDLMRAALDAGLPVFGSCWGVQVAAAVAGGDAGRNPRGPEYGFARGLVPSRGGRGHPLLDGRPASYEAPAMHLDAVIVPPPGAEVLAGNGRLDVQAIEIRAGTGVFWGTQYHPEHELGAMLRLQAAEVVEAGFCRTSAEVEAYAADLEALHAAPRERTDLAWRHGIGAEVLEASNRRREIANFLDRLVRPRTRR
ncbi:GMP synthase (glutamine-hydrolyzing) [Methylobacterium sp. BE186]|uniref:glutamine amidotransferase-related protein n=1 Tax=Methylobacterium sp. BE186 TaxID=2817715 RepID=UPI00285A86CE|nr:type 1 glutamine amidotransferase [Methylobacterium sp. BE186]MDR7036963.1 GMP synthase (glutamine-hydrolyzing) [Methylobacterium sp. BE186]